MKEEFIHIKKFENKDVTIIKKINNKDYFYNGIINNIINGDSGIIIFIHDNKINDIVMINCKDIIIIPRGGEDEYVGTYRN